MIRTQYNRAAFQVPFDATVRISLDTNLAMIKENTDGQPVGLLHRFAFCLPFVGYLLFAFRGVPSVCLVLFACCVPGARFRARLDMNLALIPKTVEGRPVEVLHTSAFCLLFALCLLWL